MSARVGREFGKKLGFKYDEDIKPLYNKPPSQGTPITPYKTPSLVNNAMNIGNPSGIPYRNTTTVPATVTINNVHIKDGKAFSDNATITMKNLNSF